MALPNLSTLSIATEDEVDTNDQFDPQHDAWTGPPVNTISKRGPPVRRRSLSKPRQHADQYHDNRSFHQHPEDDEPYDTIPDEYNGNESYFTDPARRKLVWGFIFRQQRYPFARNGEKKSTELMDRVQVKKRFERKDGLANTCLRKQYKGKVAPVFYLTTTTATEMLKKAIDNWHSIAFVANERDDLLGVMALGQRVRHTDPISRLVTFTDHQMKLPSEWINGMRTLIRQKGIHRQKDRRAPGQGNYTPKERHSEVTKRRLNFYIEWVCTASNEHVKNLPSNLAVKGVGKTLLHGLIEFIRAVYIEPCAHAYLVEQWSLADFENTPDGDYNALVPASSVGRREAQRIIEGMPLARAEIEYWAFLDFIALDSAKNAWKAMGFCQSEGVFEPWDGKLSQADWREYYQGPSMYRPLEEFTDDYKCKDGR